MRLMILDGNSIVNRAFYGVRTLNAPDGTPTNAVFGFLNILQRMLDEQKPDAVCFCHRATPCGSVFPCPKLLLTI